MTNRHLPKLLLAGLVFFCLAANGADLAQVKRDGIVGERADGYLGLVVQTAGADVRALVADINARRRSKYERIARSNNLTMEQVQALAGKKAIGRTARGHWIRANGGWRRK